MARYGDEWRGSAGCGLALYGKHLRGDDGFGQTGPGMAGIGRERQGLVFKLTECGAMKGEVWLGLERQCRARNGKAGLGRERRGKDGMGMARQGISCHIDYGLINLATGEQTAERGTICIRSTMKMPTLRQAALKTAQDKYQIPGVVAVTGVRIVKFAKL